MSKVDNGTQASGVSSLTCMQICFAYVHWLPTFCVKVTCVKLCMAPCHICTMAPLAPLTESTIIVPETDAHQQYDGRCVFLLEYGHKRSSSSSHCRIPASKCQDEPLSIWVATLMVNMLTEQIRPFSSNTSCVFRARTHHKHCRSHVLSVCAESRR